MGYIMNLRKKVGHDPLIMTSACAIILNDKNQILLQLRKDNHQYSYPGGSLELGETFEEACIREVKEETGLDIKNLKLYKINSGEDMHYIYPNKDEVYIAEAIFLIRDFSGNLKVQEEEVIEQDFFDLDHIPNNITSFNQRTLNEFIEEFKLGKIDFQ